MATNKIEIDVPNTVIGAAAVMLLSSMFGVVISNSVMDSPYLEPQPFILLLWYVADDNVEITLGGSKKIFWTGVKVA